MCSKSVHVLCILFNVQCSMCSKSVFNVCMYCAMCKCANVQCISANDPCTVFVSAENQSMNYSSAENQLHWNPFSYIEIHEVIMNLFTALQQTMNPWSYIEISSSMQQVALSWITAENVFCKHSKYIKNSKQTSSYIPNRTYTVGRTQYLQRNFVEKIKT